MGPVMPPSKKPEGSGISVPSGLSQRYQDSDLSKALHDDEDLDFSLPAIRLDKGAMEDEELTNLNWLHESKNLLKSFGDSVLRSVSPVQDIGDDTPPSPAHSDMPYDAKQNPNCKPPYSFSCLIFMAIEDSPTKRLPVKDIYNWILEHFPYFANAPTGWKNSVRHNLSLNKCFKKVDKDRSQSIGKGSLWCIDPEYRQNLIQALKKTPYHPYSHVFNTPPTSPQAYQSTSGPPIWPGSTFFKRNGALLQGRWLLSAARRFLSWRGDGMHSFLCGVWTAAGCHGNRKPPQLRTEMLHRDVFAGKWLQRPRHPILLGSRAAFEYLIGD